MIQINLGQAGQVPLYQQIAQQVKLLIASTELKVGERLPAVRELAHSLKINPGTVARSYQALEKEGVVSSRRGGGTVVATGYDNAQLLMLRRGRLANMVSGNILEALSMGYTPEELEAAFSLQLAYWQEERDSRKRTAVAGNRKRTAGRKDLRIAGSNDLALNILVERLKRKNPGAGIAVINSGSLGGLIALQEGTADLAGIHLLDEETGEYNYPYVKRILPGRAVAILHLACRVQGLIFAEGNPRKISGLEDLKSPGVTMVNRQKSSGTRVLLDLTLHQMGIETENIRGYREEVDTHLALASRIAGGKADVGPGIEAAARSYNLGFLPLFRERYDLVITAEKYHGRLLKSLVEIARSEEFRRIVTEMGGYDTSETGNLTFIH